MPTVTVPGRVPKTPVSVAVNVGIFNNTAVATVHGGAMLDGLRATRVVSNVTYPFLSELDTYAPTSLGEFVDSVRTDGAEGGNPVSGHDARSQRCVLQQFGH